jgi:hypothetical protein
MKDKHITLYVAGFTKCYVAGTPEVEVYVRVCRETEKLYIPVDCRDFGWHGDYHASKPKDALPENIATTPKEAVKGLIRLAEREIKNQEAIIDKLKAKILICEKYLSDNHQENS